MNLPNDATGKVLKRLSESGSDLAQLMEMEFFVGVPSNRSGENVASEARNLGFNTSVEKDEETGLWTCYCTKAMVPAYSEVAKIELELGTIAKRYGGHMDGFGSFGN